MSKQPEPEHLITIETFSSEDILHKEAIVIEAASLSGITPEGLEILQAWIKKTLLRSTAVVKEIEANDPATRPLAH